MITSAIFNLFFGIVAIIIDLLPEPSDINVLTPINDAYAAIVPYLEIANGFFPVDTLVIILSLMFGIETAIIAIRAGNWVFDKIRGAG